MKLYYDNDADLNLLKDKTVAIIGYGSQGHAHALNLKESGVNVVVGLNEGNPDIEKAEAAGLTVLLNDEAAKKADIIMILVPDQIQPVVYENDIRLSIEGSQLVGPYADRNVVEITDARKWLRGEEILTDYQSSMYIIVKCGEDFMGSGKIVNGRLKNYISKTRRIGSVD